MSAEDFAAARRLTGLGVVEFGRALGYRGDDNSVSVHVRRLERGARPVLEPIARLAAMFALHGVPWHSKWRPAMYDRMEYEEAWAIVDRVDASPP